MMLERRLLDWDVALKFDLNILKREPHFVVAVARVGMTSLYSTTAT
jgi:hypothetical protein